ncbi:MAG: photosystem II reaction center PsbP family protein [Actinomycetota bacterium]|nr:photosystem II reaction center PsbP family protein [Actinomycetota bacterium]
MTSYRPRTRGAAALVAFVVIMALALVACGDDPKAPTTTAPEGFTVMSDDKEGFALAVPADWTRIPLSNNPDVFNKNANALRLANPKLASILNQARVLGQAGGKFMAVNPDGTASVNLTVDKPKEKTIEEIVRNSIAGLQSFDATNIQQEATTLDGKPAVKLTFRIPVETDDGLVPTDEVQHYLLDGDKAYILSILAAPPEVASTMVSTFRLR